MEENVHFNRTTKGMRGVVEYSERLENLEERFDSRGQKDQKKGQVGKNISDLKRKGKSEAEPANNRGSDSYPTWTKDCLVHGQGCGHPSHKCKVLMDHAGKVKGQYLAATPGPRKAYSKTTNSKPWQKDKTEKSYSKKEVQLLLKRNEERKTEKEAENFQAEQAAYNSMDQDLESMDFDHSALLDEELDSCLRE